MSGPRYRAGVRFGLGAPESCAHRRGRSGAEPTRLCTSPAARSATASRRRSIRATQHGRAASGASHSSETRPSNVAPEVAAKLDGRVIDAWDGESGRLGDRVLLRQGFGVVLGHFSMARHPRPRNAHEPTPADIHRAKVDWINDLPPDGHAGSFTVLVTDAGVALAGPPGAEPCEPCRSAPSSCPTAPTSGWCATASRSPSGCANTACGRPP